jgi:hypothetical protein
MSFIKRILGIPEPKINETEAERTVRKIRDKFQISDSLADEIIGKKSKDSIPSSPFLCPQPTIDHLLLERTRQREAERIRQREEAERVRSEIRQKMEEERRRREEQIRKFKAKLDEDILSIQDCFYELGDISNNFSVDSPSLGCYSLNYEILGVGLGLTGCSSTTTGAGMRLTDKVLDMFRTIRPSSLRAKSLFPEYTFSISFERNRVIIRVVANMDQIPSQP